MDDIDPARNAGHAAILRSQLRARAHRPARCVRRARASGRRRRPHRRGRRRDVEPVPGRGREPAALLRRRPRGRALRGRAARRRRRPRPLHRRGRGRADRGGVRAARAGARRRGAARSSPTARSRTATPTRRSPPPTSSSRAAIAFPRWTACPIECYGVVADWNEATGVLTAWANFQGPFTLHSVAAGALGLKGSKLRLITPPNSGGSFGIKATVYVYVVLIGPRLAQARRAGALDGGPARAPGRELGVDRADHRPRGRVHLRR